MSTIIFIYFWFQLPWYATSGICNMCSMCVVYVISHLYWRLTQQLFIAREYKYYNSIEIPHKFMHSIQAYCIMFIMFTWGRHIFTLLWQDGRGGARPDCSCPARPSRPKSINVCLIMNNLHLKCFLWFKLRNFDYKWYCVLATRLGRCLAGERILGPIND